MHGELAVFAQNRRFAPFRLQIPGVAIAATLLPPSVTFGCFAGQFERDIRHEDPRHGDLHRSSHAAVEGHRAGDVALDNNGAAGLKTTADSEAGQTDGGHEEQEASVQFFGSMEAPPQRRVLVWHGRQ